MPWLTPQDKAQPPRDSSARPCVCVGRMGRLGPEEALEELGGLRPQRLKVKLGLKNDQISVPLQAGTILESGP